MASKVNRVPATDSAVAAEHFQRLLSLETDCSDVHHAIANNTKDFVLLDVRSQELYDKGHIPESVCLPHCNGPDNAALKLARLHRRVKRMIGGVTGWIDEGYELAQT